MKLLTSSDAQNQNQNPLVWKHNKRLWTFNYKGFNQPEEKRSLFFNNQEEKHDQHAYDHTNQPVLGRFIVDCWLWNKPGFVPEKQPNRTTESSETRTAWTQTLSLMSPGGKSSDGRSSFKTKPREAESDTTDGSGSAETSLNHLIHARSELLVKS